MTNYVDSADGVKIAYATSGSGEPALLFIHGGLADRTFWSNQIDAFADRFKVIAPDLVGHGESGRQRSAWSIQAFGADIRAVLEVEKVKRAVLIGNSLGGPAAVEAAVLVPRRVIGVVGVDTFHLLDHRVDPSEMRARAAAYREDPAVFTKQLLSMLFHPDADPVLVNDVEQRMARNSDESLGGMFESFADYDPRISLRRLKVPIRCINGDLFPLDIEKNRLVYPDFDAVVFKHCGHYPMLEQPEEFNRRLADILSELR